MKNFIKQIVIGFLVATEIVGGVVLMEANELAQFIFAILGIVFIAVFLGWFLIWALMENDDATATDAQN